MKALKYLFYVIFGIGAFWILMCLFAKKAYHIERKIEIEAPRVVVYEQIRLFRNFTNWSPWHFMDPNMAISIEGPDGTAGTVYKWDSKNKSVGSGFQKIVSVTPGRIDYLVDFGLVPSPSYFLIEGDSMLTKVTWAIEMHLPFFMRAGGMLTDLNAYVGKDYGNGLANLKKYCEALSPIRYRGYPIKQMDRSPVFYAVVRDTVDFQNISQFFADNSAKTKLAAEKAGAKMVGRPSGLFWTYDTLGMKTDMAAAIPLDKQVKLGDSLKIVSLGGRALVIDYLGDFAKTSDAHSALTDYMTEKKLQLVPPFMEEYVTDPAQEPDTAKWLTKIIYFVVPKIDSTAQGKN